MLLLLVVVLSFVHCTFTDPGVVPRANDGELRAIDAPRVRLEGGATVTLK